MALLGSVLKARKEKIDRTKVAFADLQPLSIHFDGSVSKRKVAEGKEYTMDLWFARPGDIVVSKIDLKNGAVGIVPDDWENIAVTGHFAVYEPLHGKVLPAYFHLLIQSQFFKDHLWRNKVGAEGRKEVKLNFFESELVPMPSLATQQAIVDHWKATQKKNAAALRAADEHEAEVEKQLIRQLGYSILSTKPKRKAFAVNWSGLGRWSVEFHQHREISQDPTTGKYVVRELGDVAIVSYGIQKAPSNRPGSHPHPYLRVANVQRGALDLTVIKHINVPPNELHRFLLRPGDLLVCEGNSAELVGRPAIWNGEIAGCVHQNHLLRVRANREVVLPEYLLHWMNLPIARTHFRSRAKATTNLSSINSGDLRELPVALPPLPIQKQLVAEVTAAREKITAERAAAAKLSADTAREVEEMILGHRPVPNAS